MEIPQYTLKPSMFRIIIPEALKTLFLCIVLYFGIFLNLKFLKIKQTFALNIAIAFIVLVILIINVLIYYGKFMNYKYIFYANRIEFQGGKPKEIILNYVQNIEMKQNFLDRILNTGNIVVAPNFEIKAAPNLEQVYLYIQRLVQAARYRYSYQ